MTPEVFAATRARFELPDGITYLDGNSLGPLPRGVGERVAEVTEAEWGGQLIRGWNVCEWMAQPTLIGDRIARLIGAAPGTTVLGDTLSIKVYQAVAAGCQLRPRRRVVLSDSGNFPTDLYMVEGLLGTLGDDYELRVVAPEEVAAAIDETVAVLMLTEVDYRTGRLHDMADLTARAHAAGAVAVWDLAHSAGAIPVDVTATEVDIAVGCTYKYLNGGPGAPAFIYVRPDHVDTMRPALSGWLGHEAPFSFDLDYRPGIGIERMRVGTPPVIQLAALDAALDVWDGIEMAEVRARSIDLSERLIEAVEATCPAVTLASPRDPAHRGSQVSFRFQEGYAAMQALIDRGVIGDFRAPDIMRFGITPLYLSEADIDRAAEHIAAVVNDRLWDRPEYLKRARVT